MGHARAIALTTAGIAVGIGGLAASARYLAIRRRSGGMIRLAEMIPVHSAHWREQRKKAGELLYVAIGDSAAQGIGASRPSHSYVGLLARSIRHQSKKTLRVVNLSQSGARLREAVDKQEPAIRGLIPDIVTVAIGANDIGSPDGFDPERFERELRVVYGALPGHAIVADLPSFYFGEAERKVRAANMIVRKVASDLGLAVAPLYEVTRGRTAARTALRDVAADFFHPNDRGYQAWASAFAPLVAHRVNQLLAARG